MKEFFQEATGQLSMMRFLVALVVVIQSVTWAVCCMKSGDLLPMPGENVGMTLGAMGLKGWQKGKENRG